MIITSLLYCITSVTYSKSLFDTFCGLIICVLINSRLHMHSPIYMGNFRPGQSWWYFANDIFKCIVLNKIWNLRKANSLRRVPLDFTEHGPFVRYVKLRVVYAPGMPGTFSSPPRVSDPDVHHGTCVTHMPCWMSGSLTRGFLWTQWWGKRSLHPGACTTRNFAYLVRRQLVYEIYENVM